MRHLILGFCAAGANAAEAIRRMDPDAEIIVFNPEGTPFYLRLDLEGFIEDKPLDQLQPRPPSYWAEKKISVVTERAIGLDRAKKIVRAESGKSYAYDKLLITTGAVPKRLGVPGEELPGVHTYHTLDDARRIHELRGKIQRAVIVGAGILGLELARVLRPFVPHITLLVRGDFVGSPIADATGGEFVLRALDRGGVEVIFQDQVKEFTGEGRLSSVLTVEGRELTADFAAVCIGVQPSVSFLQDTGLLSDGRLIVNDRMQTVDPDVLAAGDVALVRMADGRQVHCYTWNVATSQTRVAASNMVGRDTAWDEGILYNLDWLFDQQIAIIGAWDRRHEPGFVIHEFREQDVFRTLVTKDGMLVGALLIGDRNGDRRIRKLIANRARVERRIERIFDPDARPEDFLATSEG